jgi:hypothetical protein
MYKILKCIDEVFLRLYIYIYIFVLSSFTSFPLLFTIGWDDSLSC